MASENQLFCFNRFCSRLRTSQPRTLSEKVWDAHLVRSAEGEPDLLYIDLHLVHEVTSPQAFDGLRLPGARCAGRS